MSFIPQTPADPAAVLGSLRVRYAHNVHAAERVIDVVLDTASDVAHQSAICANAALLSGLELQQSLTGVRTCRDVWTSMTEHGNRLHDAYFKYLDECFACRHRAFDRLYGEDEYVAG
jgi:hypothetical protein